MVLYSHYVEHNANNQLIKSTLRQRYTLDSDSASAKSDNNVYTYIAMIDRQATSQKEVCNDDELKLPKEWKCWRVRYQPANASIGRVDDTLKRSQHPSTRNLSLDKQLLQKPYSCLRFNINNKNFGYHSGMFETRTRYLKYNQRYSNEAIQLAHQPHITCLNELWQEIERTPSLRTVFFDILITSSPQQQSSSLSLRSLFERRFRFSVLHALPKSHGNDDVDTTPQIKHEKLANSVAMKDYKSTYSSKAVIILDEHTMADYWAPDEHTFKNYARLGAFRYTPPLSLSAATTATNVGQTVRLQRAHIIMPSTLQRNGVSPVLIS